jgi:hypothetical protein
MMGMTRTLGTISGTTAPDRPFLPSSALNEGTSMTHLSA